MICSSAAVQTSRERASFSFGAGTTAGKWSSPSFSTISTHRGPCRVRNEKPFWVMLSIVHYQDRHFAGVAALWRESFPNDPPWNAPETAIPEKLKMQPDLFLVALKLDKVVGSIMAGYDGHRGWISRIAVLEFSRGEGIGRTLLKHAERRLAALGCIKINLGGCAVDRSAGGSAPGRPSACRRLAGSGGARECRRCRCRCRIPRASSRAPGRHRDRTDQKGLRPALGRARRDRSAPCAANGVATTSAIEAAFSRLFMTPSAVRSAKTLPACAGFFGPCAAGPFRAPRIAEA